MPAAARGEARAAGPMSACSRRRHTFNLLDARKAISVTERQRYILPRAHARPRRGRGVLREPRGARLPDAACDDSSSTPPLPGTRLDYGSRIRMSTGPGFSSFELGTGGVAAQSRCWRLSEAFAGGVAKRPPRSRDLSSADCRTLCRTPPRLASASANEPAEQQPDRTPFERTRSHLSTRRSTQARGADARRPRLRAGLRRDRSTRSNA
jgi:hypothetical protein